MVKVGAIIAQFALGNVSDDEKERGITPITVGLFDENKNKTYHPVIYMDV